MSAGEHGREDAANDDSIDAGADFSEYHDDLAAVERRVARTLDPGVRAFVVAVAILVLILATALPHTGAASGWDVLLRDDDAHRVGITLPSTLFVWFSLIAGVLVSGAAVLTRSWAVAWLATAGCAITVVLGVLAIWSRQTPLLSGERSGPGLGLLLAWFAVVVLTATWVRLAWAHSATVAAAVGPDPRGLPRLR